MITPDYKILIHNDNDNNDNDKDLIKSSTDRYFSNA